MTAEGVPAACQTKACGLPGRSWHVETHLGLSVPAEGGIRLRTDIHRPAGDGAWPALLLRTPYGSGEIGLLRFARLLAARGLGVVLQNVRGRYGSCGCFEPFRHEVKDGRATLAWLARQHWCDGTVIGIGSSYSSYTALALQAAAPPDLRLTGVISLAGMASPYRHFYRNGAFVLHWALPWHFLIDGPRQISLDRIDLHRLARPPLEEIPRLTGRPSHPWLDWVRNRSEEDACWRRADLVPVLKDHPIPVLHIGGWFDFSLASTVDLFGALAGSSADQTLVIGPWEHNQIFPSLLAGLETLERGLQAGDSSVLAETFLAALGRWLGLVPERGGRPPVLLWQWAAGQAKVGRWKGFGSWPLPSDQKRWFLSPGRLAEEFSTSVDMGWIHEPGDPVPTLGGRCWAARGWTASGPLDQAPIEGRSDVLVFTGGPLTAALDIAGSPRALLWTDADQEGACDWTAKLVDVAPDGRATWVTDGVVRETPEAVRERAAARAPVAIEMGPTFYLFPAGHRLRLEIAASSFPQFDPTPVAGRRRLFCGAGTPSQLLLPVVTGAAGGDRR